MPVTTPMLVGARVRLTDRNMLELVVPRTSAGRGISLAGWDQIGTLCQLGVYDTRLVARVGALQVISPGTCGRPACR